MKNKTSHLEHVRNRSYPDRVDTRLQTKKLFEKLEFSSWESFTKTLLCLVIAFSISFFPEFEELTVSGHRALYILIFASGLWITEAIPAFSVAILVIALEIALLGLPGNGFSKEGGDWQIYVHTWSSPLIWLFFGGFVMASAAHRTHLDRWLGSHIIGWFGNRPSMIMAGTMLVTFVFSMFMSNTSTAAMMMTVVTPILISLKKNDPFIKVLLLSVPFAANLGGMGTIIGTPPNAIAAGALASISDSPQITFIQWMFVGIPVAVILFAVAYVYLLLRYPCGSSNLDFSGIGSVQDDLDPVPFWKHLLVMVKFAITIFL